MDKSFLSDDLKHVFSQGGEILFWPLLCAKKAKKCFSWTLVILRVKAQPCYDAVVVRCRKNNKTTWFEFSRESTGGENWY